MPNPADYKTRDEFISACVPIVLNEGTAQDADQALAICSSMWDEHKSVVKSFPVEIIKSTTPGYDATFVMSASAPDRVKDTIDPAAYTPNLGKKLIALWQHDHDHPIGYWENIIFSSAKQLIGDIKFASTQLAQMVKTLINDDVPLGASIGFRGKGEENELGGIHFKTLELMECSIVSVPCHPQAMQIAKSFGFSFKDLSVPELLLDRQKKVALARAAAAVKSVDLILKERS